MQGQVDTSFETVQRDLFASGLAARIGTQAFALWLAIKSHADYSTGKAWPGMRRLGELTGLSLGSVVKGVKTLQEYKLLRVVDSPKGSKSRKGNTYIARERLDVRVGDVVMCTIVIDYVPATVRHRLQGIKQALQVGEPAPEVFANCEIIPGPGFAFNPEKGVFESAIPASALPPPVPDLTEEQLKAPLVAKVLAIQKRVRSA